MRVHPALCDGSLFLSLPGFVHPEMAEENRQKKKRNNDRDDRSSTHEIFLSQ